MAHARRPFYQFYWASVCSWRAGGVLKAVGLMAAVSVVSACESPRLPPVFQGSSVPITAKTAPKPPQTPPAETSDKPQARQIARPLPPLSSPQGQAPAEASGESKTPSLLPLLTARPKGAEENLSTQATAPLASRAPITPLAPSSTVRVALLVPLSGPYGKLGEALLNAAQLALWLARAGYPEHWDTGERIVRARLLPSQITHDPGLRPAVDDGC